MKMKQDRSALLSGNTALFAGCLHARPDERLEDWDRFSALGRMALDFRVGSVVLTGDIADNPAAMDWNSPKRQECKRVLADRQAGIDATAAIMSAHKEQASKHKRQGHPERIWSPNWLIAAGNHDDKEDDIVQKDPKLEGLIGSNFLYEAWRKQGWKVWSYKRQMLNLEYPEIHGTFYGHYYPTGQMRNAAPVRTVLSQTHDSFIFSHTHDFGTAMHRGIRGCFSQAVNIGTYQPNNRLRPKNWSGAVILSEMKDGEFQIHQFSYDWIMRSYGEGGYAQELRTARAQEHRLRRTADEAFGVAAE